MRSWKPSWNREKECLSPGLGKSFFRHTKAVKGRNGYKAGGREERLGPTLVDETRAHSSRDHKASQTWKKRSKAAPN